MRLETRRSLGARVRCRHANNSQPRPKTQSPCRRRLPTHCVQRFAPRVTTRRSACNPAHAARWWWFAPATARTCRIGRRSHRRRRSPRKSRRSLLPRRSRRPALQVCASPCRASRHTASRSRWRAISSRRRARRSRPTESTRAPGTIQSSTPGVAVGVAAAGAEGGARLRARCDGHPDPQRSTHTCFECE